VLDGETQRKTGSVEESEQRRRETKSDIAFDQNSNQQACLSHENKLNKGQTSSSIVIFEKIHNGGSEKNFWIDREQPRRTLIIEGNCFPIFQQRNV
jgi:hypothetical protein